MGEIQTRNPSRHWRFSVKNYDTLLPPGPLAEQVDPDDALAGMRHCMTLRKAEGHFHSAWHHIEYAMNQHVECLDDELRRKYLGDASYLLGGIIDPHIRGSYEYVNPSLYAQALTLNIYIPVLTKRALKQDIIPEDCANIYTSFGAAFRDINSLQYPDASYKSARFAEMVGPALSARTMDPAKLLYASSPREEASISQQLNHDGYFIKSANKIPLQTKLIATEKTYTEPTRTIYIEPIARHALIRSEMISKEDTLAMGECTLIIAELIAEESIGITDKKEKMALDFLTRSIIARYEYDDTAA